MSPNGHWQYFSISKLDRRYKWASLYVFQCWQSNQGCDKYLTILASHFQKVACLRSPRLVQHRVISYLLLVWALFQQIAKGKEGAGSSQNAIQLLYSVWPKCVSKAQIPEPLGNISSSSSTNFRQRHTSLFMTTRSKSLTFAKVWISRPLQAFFHFSDIGH